MECFIIGSFLKLHSASYLSAKKISCLGISIRLHLCSIYEGTTDGKYTGQEVNLIEVLRRLLCFFRADATYCGNWTANLLLRLIKVP